MRFVEEVTDAGKPLERTTERDALLEAYIREELEDAFGGRIDLDQGWLEDLRQYAAVPKNPARATVGIENAPNIEIALGALAADAVYAQFLDLIFNVEPVVTVRPVGKDLEDRKDADALQRRVNLGVANEWNFRPAVEHAALDWTQLGTGVFYVPHVTQVQKTDIRRTKFKGPRIKAWPVEDLIVAAGSTEDVQTLPWIGLRSWMAPGELKAQARAGKWDTACFQPTGNRGWVRSQRETIGRTRASATRSDVFEVIHLWLHFDYDQDGEDEDIYAVFDRSSGRLGFAGFHTYDSRAISVARYQLRAFLLYGMGILEMSRSYQTAVSEMWCDALLNVRLSNAKFWKAKEGVIPDDMAIWSNKVQHMPNPETDLIAEAMSGPAPQVAQYIAMTISMAERRVGVNEMSLPRPSQVLGARTPGITAISLLQQVNRRFTPAFDQMRLACAEAVKQCTYREQERVLAGDADASAFLKKLLGDDDAARVIRLYRDPDFCHAMKVELTASSASANKAQDRQDAVMLVNVLGGYYQRVLELVQIASNPQVPKPVADVARKIADAGGEIIARTLRTFDQVRDVDTFVIDVDQELNNMQGTLDGAGLMGLMQLLTASGNPTGAAAAGTLPEPSAAA